MIDPLDANPYDAALKVLDELRENGKVSYDNNDFYGRFDAFKAAFLEGSTLGEACKAMLKVLPELSDDVQTTALNQFRDNLTSPTHDGASPPSAISRITTPVRDLVSAIRS